MIAALQKRRPVLKTAMLVACAVVMLVSGPAPADDETPAPSEQSAPAPEETSRLTVLPKTIHPPEGPPSPEELAKPLPTFKGGVIEGADERIRLLLHRTLAMSLVMDNQQRWKQLSDQERKLLVRRWYGFLRQADASQIRDLLDKKRHFDSLEDQTQQRMRDSQAAMEKGLTPEEKKQLAAIDVRALVRRLSSEQRRRLLSLSPVEQFRELIRLDAADRAGTLHAEPTRIR